jgi:hypothetical protein
MDPRSVFCLTGIALRIAQRMGLNSDGTRRGLRPFEAEMGRRLWWQIILLDQRVAQLSGAGSSLPTPTPVWTTKLPLNVNDSYLFPDMKQFLTEQPGVTEMLFVLQRCEVLELSQQLRAVNESLDLKDKTVDGLEGRLEQKYFKYCDPLVPLHSISRIMAKSALCKLRMSFRPRLLFTIGKDLSTAERDKVFILSLTILENDNTLLSRGNIKCFIWHVYTKFHSRHTSS